MFDAKSARVNYIINSEINLLLVSDRLTPGGVRQVTEPLEAQMGKIVEVVILTKQEYADRIIKNQSFIGRLMEQPKIWLLGKRHR